jgi:hypothetical protein
LRKFREKQQVKGSAGAKKPVCGCLRKFREMAANCFSCLKKYLEKAWQTIVQKKLIFPQALVCFEKNFTQTRAFCPSMPVRLILRKQKPVFPRLLHHSAKGLIF